MAYYQKKQSRYKTIPIRNTIFFEPASSDEVINIIESLNKNTTKGHDNISVKVLKALKVSIGLPIAHIFNLIIETEAFPEVLKTALVLLIYKAGDSHLYINYRLITLISKISKITEKFLNKRIMDFLNKYNILTENQYGFRKGVGKNNAMSYMD